MGHGALRGRLPAVRASAGIVGSRAFHGRSAARRTPGGAWRMTLAPKDAQLARFLSTIEVRGCTRVDGVVVRQTDGDSIELERRP